MGTSAIALLGQVCGHAIAALLLGVLPAWWLVRGIPLDPLTRLMVAGLTSFTLLFLIQAGAYVAGIGQSAAVLIVVAFCLVSLATSIADWFRPMRTDEARFSWPGVCAWAVAAFWALAPQCRVVVHGLPGSFGDWYEHYHRSLFFLKGLPPDTVFLDLYSMPARGPLFNAAAAMMMAVLGHDEYWCYQIIATVLNTFYVIPLALLFRDVAGVRQPIALMLAVLAAGFLPFFVWNETYTWTKMFATAFVLGGLHLYTLGVRGERLEYCVWSFPVFAAGILAHYLVALYCLVVAAHFVLQVFRVSVFRAGPMAGWKACPTMAGWKARPTMAGWTGCLTELLRAMVAPILVGGCLLAIWFGYLFAAYGVANTMGANTATGDEYMKVLERKGAIGANWGRMLVCNLVNTVVPGRFRTGAWLAATGLECSPPKLGTIGPAGTEESDDFGALRLSIGDFPGALRWTGSFAVALAGIVYLRKRRDAASNPVRWFWIWLVVIGLPLNIVPNRWYCPFGAATINLQPYIALLLVFAVSQLRALPVSVNAVLLTVFIIEGGIATRAMTAVQEFTPPVVYFADTDEVMGKRSFSVHLEYLNNYRHKLRVRAEYLSDHLGDGAAIASHLFHLAGAACFMLLASPLLARRMERRLESRL